MTVVQEQSQGRAHQVTPEVRRRHMDLLMAERSRRWQEFEQRISPVSKSSPLLELMSRLRD